MKEIWLIVTTTLKNKWLIITILGILSIVFLWLYAAILPTMMSQMDQVNELLKAFPPELMKAFNADISGITTYAGLLATKQYGLILPIMIVVLTASFSGSAFAGEIESGTILLNLSQPISRVKYFIGKYFAGLIAIIIVSVLSILPGALFAEIYNLSYELNFFIEFSILTIVFGFTMFSFGCLASTIFNSGSKVAFFNTGLFLFFYITFVISGLTPELENIKYFSLLHYYNPAALFGIGEYSQLAIPIMIVLILCTSFGALVVFNKKDISIR